MRTENSLQALKGWFHRNKRDLAVGSLLTTLATASIYVICHGSIGLEKHHFQFISLEGLGSLGGGGLGLIGTAVLIGVYIRYRKQPKEKNPAFCREPTPEENENLTNINKFFDRLPNNHFVCTNKPEFGMCVAYKDEKGECFLTFHPDQKSLDKRVTELMSKFVRQLILIKKS